MVVVFFTYFIVIHREVALLFFKLGHQSFGLLFDGHVLFQQPVLCFQLLIILAWGCTTITNLYNKKYIFSNFHSLV